MILLMLLNKSKKWMSGKRLTTLLIRLLVSCPSMENHLGDDHGVYVDGVFVDGVFVERKYREDHGVFVERKYREDHGVSVDVFVERRSRKTSYRSSGE